MSIVSMADAHNSCSFANIVFHILYNYGSYTLENKNIKVDREFMSTVTGNSIVDDLYVGIQLKLSKGVCTSCMSF